MTIPDKTYAKIIEELTAEESEESLYDSTYGYRRAIKFSLELFNYCREKPITEHQKTFDELKPIFNLLHFSDTFLFFDVLLSQSIPYIERHDMNVSSKQLTVEVHIDGNKTGYLIDFLRLHSKELVRGHLKLFPALMQYYPTVYFVNSIEVLCEKQYGEMNTIDHTNYYIKLKIVS